jgi:hypothetical protein
MGKDELPGMVLYIFSAHQMITVSSMTEINEVLPVTDLQ